MQPIPILLVTGGSGAGKTCLLRFLLRQPLMRRREAVALCWERGTAGIDALRLAGAGHEARSIPQDGPDSGPALEALAAELRKIAEDDTCGQVLVEASATADPTDLRALLAEPFLADRFRLQANLFVLDAGRPTLDAPATARQLAGCDGVLINKTDLADSAALDALDEQITRLAGEVPRLRTRVGRAAWTWISALAPREGREAPSPPAPAEEDLTCVCIDSDATFDESTLCRQLDDLGPKLLRLKGLILLGVGLRRIEIAGGRQIAAEVTETVPARTRLMVLARGVDEATLRQQLSAARVAGEDAENPGGND
jgi:cobalamin biosynthesis protein CobW